MQYKTITYKRVIVPKAYESKTLEITIELNEGDDTDSMTRSLMKQVEDLIQIRYDEIDSEELIAIDKKLEKAKTFQTVSKSQKDLDNINF